MGTAGGIVGIRNARYCSTVLLVAIKIPVSEIESTENSPRRASHRRVALTCGRVPDDFADLAERCPPSSGYHELMVAAGVDRAGFLSRQLVAWATPIARGKGSNGRCRRPTCQGRQSLLRSAASLVTTSAGLVPGFGRQGDKDTRARAQTELVYDLVTYRSEAVVPGFAARHRVRHHGESFGRFLQWS